MNVEDLLNMKIDDNPKLKASIEKYRNTDYGEKFASFDLFEKTQVQKLRSSKERKVWKLKRINVKLGQQRKACCKEVKAYFTLWGNSGNGQAQLWLRKIENLSEQIGKNSNKIQRLRTLIQQEKLSEEV